MMTHYPLSDDQRQALNRDLAILEDKLADIVRLLRASCGEDESVVRAEEAGAAVQRLVWAVERMDKAPVSRHSHV